MKNSILVHFFAISAFSIILSLSASIEKLIVTKSSEDEKTERDFDIETEICADETSLFVELYRNVLQQKVNYQKLKIEHINQLLEEKKELLQFHDDMWCLEEKILSDNREDISQEMQNDPLDYPRYKAELWRKHLANPKNNTILLQMKENLKQLNWTEKQFSKLVYKNFLKIHKISEDYNKNKTREDDILGIFSKIISDRISAPHTQTDDDYSQNIPYSFNEKQINDSEQKMQNQKQELERSAQNTLETMKMVFFNHTMNDLEDRILLDREDIKQEMRNETIALPRSKAKLWQKLLSNPKNNTILLKIRNNLKQQNWTVVHFCDAIYRKYEKIDFIYKNIFKNRTKDEICETNPKFSGQANESTSANATLVSLLFDKYKEQFPYITELSADEQSQLDEILAEFMKNYLIILEYFRNEMLKVLNLN